MGNPFKFESVVSENFFTDRVEETRCIERLLNSENHLILISPRRYGKTSLVYRALKQAGKPYIAVNLQSVTSSVELAALLLQKLLAMHPFEQLKHAISKFRVVPTFKLDPQNNSLSVGFVPGIDGTVAIEDALGLMRTIASEDNRLVVVFDEFQTILEFEKGLDRKMRSLMQELTHVNFILMGSQESMMTDIFEKKKSPFYHFGSLLYLKRIPREDFLKFISERLDPVTNANTDSKELAEEILRFTQCHPYYTQQLSAEVWQLLRYEVSQSYESAVQTAIAQITSNHEMDYERLWRKFNLMQRMVLVALATDSPVAKIREKPTSTTYSALSRLVQAGYVIKEDAFSLEDPFFGLWIRKLKEKNA